MNAAALAQMKLVSSLLTELVQRIRDSARSQHFPSHLETIIYQSIQNTRQKVYVLSFWESIRTVPAFMSLYQRRVAKEVTVSARVQSLSTFQLVKD